MRSDTCLEDPALRAVVREFAERHGHRWSNPSAADGKCHQATTAFVAFARARGIRARFVRAQHRTWGEGVRQYAAEVDGVVIDWTARGNSPDVDGVPHRGRGWNKRAPLPVIRSLSDFYAAWGEPVDVCPECCDESGHAFLGRCYGIPSAAELDLTESARHVNREREHQK